MEKTITINRQVDIDFEDLKNAVLEELMIRLEDEYNIQWYVLDEQSREIILENLLQEFSK